MKTNNLFCRTVTVCAFLFLLNLHNLTAQVGIGTTTPNTSSALDVTSTNSGVLFPRMTTVLRDLIAAPAAGLLIYNTTTSTFDYNLGPDGTANWVSLDTTAGTRAIHYESTDSTTDIMQTTVVRIPLFGNQVFNDDATLFTIQPDGATIQVNEAGRYRITVNIFITLNEGQGLAMAVFRDDGAGGIAFPSENGAAGTGNTTGTTNGVSTIVASLNLNTVLDFAANDQFFIGSLEFGTTTGGTVFLMGGGGSRSNIIIEKIN